MWDWSWRALGTCNQNKEKRKLSTSLPKLTNLQVHCVAYPKYNNTRSLTPNTAAGNISLPLQNLGPEPAAWTLTKASLFGLPLLPKTLQNPPPTCTCRKEAKIDRKPGPAGKASTAESTAQPKQNHFPKGKPPGHKTPRHDAKVALMITNNPMAVSAMKDSA